MAEISLKTKKNITASTDTIMQVKREENIQKLPIAKLVPYDNQPFRPYTKDKLIALAEDIRDNGVLNPIIVRQFEGGVYQILAGHNRVEACKMLGMDFIPSIIKLVNDNQAALIMLNTNLNQRDELLPSEKAFAYKMQADVKREAGTNCPSLSAVAEENNTNRKEIYRYIRLTFLAPSFLERVDNKEISFIVGVNLSYLTEAQQKGLLEYIDAYGIKITLDQSERLKDAAKVSEPEGILISMLDGIFDRAPKPVKEKIPPSPFKKAYTAAGKRLEQYFTEGQEAEEIEDIIVTAVKEYLKTRNGEPA